MVFIGSDCFVQLCSPHVEVKKLSLHIWSPLLSGHACVYLCEAHELVDVLGQEDYVSVCCYHGDEAPQRLQVHIVQESIVGAIIAAVVAAGWKETKCRIVSMEVTGCLYFPLKQINRLFLCPGPQPAWTSLTAACF